MQWSSSRFFLDQMLFSISINVLDERIEGAVIKFVDDTNWERTANTSEDRLKIGRYLAQKKCL